MNAGRNSVMLVDADREQARNLAKRLIVEGFTVTTSHDVAHARSILEAKRFSALILDVATCRSTSFDLFSWVHEILGDSLLIALVDAEVGADEISHLATRVGLIMRKPGEDRKIVEFLGTTKAQSEPEGSFSGRVDKIDILEYVQFVLLSGQRAVLEIYSRKGTRGLIFIDKGTIRHATFGDESGEEALYRCLCSKGGFFYNRAWHEPEQATIHKPADFLVFEAARLRDEHRMTSDRTDDGSRDSEEAADDKESDTDLFRGNAS